MILLIADLLRYGFSLDLLWKSLSSVTTHDVVYAGGMVVLGAIVYRFGRDDENERLRKLALKWQREHARKDQGTIDL